MKVTEECEKVGLKPNIQKTKIMASGPITSQEINGETVETVSQLFTSGDQSIGASASASIPPVNYSGLIFFRIDWFGLLAVQGTLKSLLHTLIQKHQFVSDQPSFLWSSSHICT